MPSVLSVIQNWRRPENVSLIASAVLDQTVKTHLVLVDCASGTEWGLSPDIKGKADTIIEVCGSNLGPCSRFIPPLLMCNFDCVMWYVDDHVPGREFCEFMLQKADELHWRFATLGQEGRAVSGGGLARSRVRSGCADCIVTSELALIKNVSHAIAFRDDLVRENPNVSTFEDDLILCMGIQRATGYPSIVATAPSPGKCWNTRRLDAPHALCARPNHRELRNEFVRTAIDCGWESKRGSCC